MKMGEEALLYVNKSGEDTMIATLKFKIRATSQIHIGISILDGEMDNHIRIIYRIFCIYILRYVGNQMQAW